MQLCPDTCGLPQPYQNYSKYLFTFGLHFSETLTEDQAKFMEDYNSLSDECQLDVRYK